MENHADRKDIFYIIVLILTFITVIVGATFAIYTLLYSQEENKASVYTGTFSIEYFRGDIISFNLLYPRRKPSFNSEKNLYKNEFQISNTGSLDGTIEIKLETTTNEFSNQTLMYSLYNADTEDELATGYISKKGTTTLINNLELKNNDAMKFILLIWLNENDKDQNQEMRKTLMGRIAVEASQKRK